MAGSIVTPNTIPGESFVSLTRRPATSIITSNLPAPVAQYVGTDALLRFQVASSVPNQPLIVRTRLLRSDDGVITTSEDIVKTDSTGSQVVTILPLTEGFLLSCEVTCDSASIGRGLMFASMELCHGTAINLHRDQLLFQDYISSGYAVSWPGGQLRLSTEGPGAVQSSLNAPGFGAGSEFAVSYAANVRVRLMSLRVVLTTSAVAGNRVPVINITQNSANVYSVPVAAPIPASTVATISLGVAVGPPSANNNVHVLPIPENLFITNAPGVISATTGLLAADAYTNIQAVWEQWIIS